MWRGRHFAEFRLGRIEPAGSWLAVGVVGADFDPREEAFSGIGHLHAQGSEEGWVLNTTDGQLDHEGGGFEWEGMPERGELKEHDRIGFFLLGSRCDSGRLSMSNRKNLEKHSKT